ncbi:hypothetical protein [Sphingomonas mucosissima]|uniref:Uncharacterized protein n=1 Tax=Sphingomonas mucosissima TaxID=370959 RepID=A0A245ZRZ0_9SPHN|nr:hypothetical protein [Sphingomonas mucosissima]OWK32508.1 hypothetical protein SPMU_08400 [Sphingomonas mucosissima]
MAAEPVEIGDAMHGLVEQLHEVEGVQGWVLDLAEPQRILDVELWAGTLCLARTQTGLERPDVCSSVGLPCRPGFRFGDEAGRAIKDAAAQGHLGDLHVRVQGSSRLEAECPVRTLEMIRPISPPTDLGSDRLRATLNQHASDAMPLVNEATASTPSNQIGYLEGIWTSESGVTWMVGWMIEDTVTDRPVIIVDEDRYSGGMAISLAPRADLAANAKAFVAVIQTDWLVKINMPPQIVLADGSGRYLEPVRPAPLMEPEAVLSIARDTLSRASGPHRAAMLKMLEANRYLPADRLGSNRVQVDEVAVLPGFGAFVNGWALSSNRQASRFVLKVGSHTVRAVELCQSRFARSDVAELLPNVEQALKTAGFVTLFPGPIDQAALDQLSLEVVWQDGTSTIVEVPPVTVRVLGLTSSFDAICRLYPAIEAERFFPELAYHAARFAQVQARSVRGYECNPVRSSLLLAAPRQSADIFLLFDQALAHAAFLPEDWGISIIASPDEHRGLVLTLFAQLQHAAGRPCSLFFTGDAAPTSDVIEEVAATLSSERIAWVASHILLTATGWKDVASDEGTFALLAIDDPAGGPPPALGLDAFVADLARWRRLCAAAPPRIGGIQLPPQGKPIPVIANAAVSLGPAPGSPFTLKINEAVRRAYG